MTRPRNGLGLPLTINRFEGSPSGAESGLSAYRRAPAVFKLGPGTGFLGRATEAYHAAHRTHGADPGRGEFHAPHRPGDRDREPEAGRRRCRRHFFAATAPSSRNGIGYDRELVARIEAASGKPATTASTALLEALRALSAKSIVLGAPWSDAVNRTTAGFIEANGFSVLAQETLGLVDNLDIGLLDPQSAYDVGRRVDRSGADAVMLACGNWSTFAIIDRLERDLGKPVLTTNQVSLWHALKIIGSEPLNGLGVLFRDHLGAKPGAVAAE